MQPQPLFTNNPAKAGASRFCPHQPPNFNDIYKLGEPYGNPVPRIVIINGTTFYNYPSATGENIYAPTSSAAPPLVMASSKANISVRDYIYFIPYYPLPPGTPVPYSTNVPHINPLNLSPHGFEPTSTLVLTSTTSIFVDIRVLKPILPEDVEELPNKGGPARRLEWAFGGKSSSQKIGGPPIGTDNENENAETDLAPTHSIWSHWVDSKYPVAATEIPFDEGDMYPQADGRTLEHGFAFNDKAGRILSYEEMWSDVETKACYPSTSMFSIVLRVQNDAARVRGLVVRVGQFCQGILKQGNDVTVERWEFVEQLDESENVIGGEWTRKVRVGDLFLPCAATFNPKELEVGSKVSFTDYHWVVEELVEWTD